MQKARDGAKLAELMSPTGVDMLQATRIKAPMIKHTESNELFYSCRDVGISKLILTSSFNFFYVHLLLL